MDVFDLLSAPSRRSELATNPGDVVALEREWGIFLREMPRLLQEGQRGKFVLIQGEAVQGVWDTLDEALAAGYDRFGLAPFLAQEINDAPKPRYFSRNITPCRP
jgi:hypothetical protein